MDCRSKERRRPISWSRSKPRVNPLLAKENPHEEHEGHKRLLVSTAFHKRRVGYKREIVFLAPWLAERAFRKLRLNEYSASDCTKKGRNPGFRPCESPNGCGGQI